MYTVTFYTKAVQPTQETFKSKKAAQSAMSEDIKQAQKDYKGTGYKKVGSIAKGRVSFEHPCFGVDYVCRIES